MRPSITVEEALRLSADGLTATEIARRLGCPRSTVKTWLAGATPGRARRAGCPRCGEHHLSMDTVAAAYVHLLGVYLGDGCISVHPRGVHRLRITCDSRYPLLIEECAASLAAVAPRNAVGRSRRASGGFAGSRDGAAIELSMYAKWWPCVLPQHGLGRKHERPIELVGWQQELVDRHPERLLRGLLQSDGCRFVNTGTNWSNPRYSFSNRSADIRRIFCDACDQLRLRWTLAPHTVYVSRKADVARLDEFVGAKA